jgi:hypothetical protein
VCLSVRFYSTLVPVRALEVARTSGRVVLKPLPGNLRCMSPMASGARTTNHQERDVRRIPSPRAGPQWALWDGGSAKVRHGQLHVGAKRKRPWLLWLLWLQMGLPPGIEQLFAALTGCAEEAAVGFLLAECWRVGRRNSDECGIALFHISTPEESTRADCKSVPVLYCIVSAMAPWHAQRCA